MTYDPDHPVIGAQSLKRIHHQVEKLPVKSAEAFIQKEKFQRTMPLEMYLL
jgi:hypothetical protein